MDSESATILIVEDEKAHAELTKRAIRKAGNKNRIDIVADGEEALDYLFNHGKYIDKDTYTHPGLILMDIKLPGIDGIDVLKRIKEHPDLRWIPVIILTTSDREEDIATSYNYHANSYLVKPIGLKAFEEKMKQMNYYWMLLNEPPAGLK